MKKLILSLLAITCCLGAMNAQILNVNSAFGQTTCKGEAGSCVTRFSINLYPYNKDVVIDSIYLSGCFGLNLKLGQHNGYLETDTINKNYTIIAFESETQARGPGNSLRHSFGGPGDALIIYEYKGKSYTLIVKRITNRPSVGNNLQ